MACDLHTHTNHSDGALSPRELVREAKKLNLTIALTDHNTVSGLPEFIFEAKKLGVRAVGGVELSSVYEGVEFHLLGLFVNMMYYDRIENLCRDYHGKKEESNIALVKRLNDAGYKIEYSEIKKRNVKGNVNRAHIAAELIKNGYVKDIAEAFEKLLDERVGYYIPPERLHLVDAIKFLREIDAIPVLAHPLKEVSEERLREILPHLIDAGLVGIETMHSSYSDTNINISKSIASDFDLLESGGSDFHGSIKPGVELGVGKGNLNIFDEIFDKLSKRKSELCR